MAEDVQALEEYRYSGHCVLMGRKEYPWQDARSVLILFAESENQARKMYESFVAEGINLGRQPELTGGGLLRSVGGWSELKGRRRGGMRIKGDERILGSSEFVEKVIRQAADDFENKTRYANQGLDLEGLLARTACYYEVAIKDLGSRSKERKVTRARSALCYLAVKKLQSSCVEVGLRLNLTPSTISKAVIRGEAVVSEDKNETELLA